MDISLYVYFFSGLSSCRLGFLLATAGLESSSELIEPVRSALRDFTPDCFLANLDLLLALASSYGLVLLMAMLEPLRAICGRLVPP